MPQLHPFRALRYSASAVPDLSAVLCPPYDVINPAERERLAARDSRNAVHIELPAADTQGAISAYEAAGRTFSSWMADGTLLRDERPVIYVYEQRYTGPDGIEQAARGFFCRLTLEPYGPNSGIRPHEATMSGPKEDRFRLMSAVAANLSPVLFLYDDHDRGDVAGQLMQAITGREPAVDAVGPGGLVNRLWVVDPLESDSARELLRIASAGPLTIADGHHRYETALRYHDVDGSPSSDHVLALLYEAHSGGLALLPWHRLLSGIDGATLLKATADWFTVTPVQSVAELIDAPLEAGAMGLWTGAGGALLKVDRARVPNALPSDESETLRWLDVSVLSSTLSQMIGSTSAALAADGRLSYLSNAADAVAQVESGRADAAFLLRPTPIEDVLAVAQAGEHMPAKSTFFYPKAATGHVFNPLTDPATTGRG